jgi:mannose/fructose-specific phosphotransferase system component IIA
MSEPVTGVVLAHGTLSAALVSAVARIAGSTDALVAVSNDGCSRSNLTQLVRDAVGDRRCLLFVDMPGGSCLQAAARLQREHASLAVVAGVNLAMLLDFVHHRDGDLPDIAQRAAKVGAEAIRIVGA